MKNSQLKVKASVTQLHPTLCNPMDCSLPGFVHGIFQARVVGQIAIPFSRGSSHPGIDPCELRIILNDDVQLSRYEYDFYLLYPPHPQGRDTHTKLSQRGVKWACGKGGQAGRAGSIKRRLMAVVLIHGKHPPPPARLKALFKRSANEV